MESLNCNLYHNSEECLREKNSSHWRGMPRVSASKRVLSRNHYVADHGRRPMLSDRTCRNLSWSISGWRTERAVYFKPRSIERAPSWGIGRMRQRQVDGKRCSNLDGRPSDGCRRLPILWKQMDGSYVVGKVVRVRREGALGRQQEAELLMLPVPPQYPPRAFPVGTDESGTRNEDFSVR